MKEKCGLTAFYKGCIILKFYGWALRNPLSKQYFVVFWGVIVLSIFT